MWRWPNFTPEELASKDGVAFPLNPDTEDFLDRLQRLRAALDFPLTISSGFRTPAHNRLVGGGPNSAHLLGRAVDILISGERAFELVGAAAQYGMTGIGVSQKGDHARRFIHLDDLGGSLRPNVWSY